LKLLEKDKIIFENENKKMINKINILKQVKDEKEQAINISAEKNVLSDIE
jgi:hypothetical protein